jgi:hypothetical protein
MQAERAPVDTWNLVFWSSAMNVEVAAELGYMLWMLLDVQAIPDQPEDSAGDQLSRTTACRCSRQQAAAQWLVDSVANDRDHGETGDPTAANRNR